MLDIKISLAQIEVKTGDINGNSNRILESIDKAISDKSDILVLPETAITGYCCGALFNNDFFIKDNIKSLNSIAKKVPSNLHVFIGFVDFKGLRKDGIPEISNTVAILNDGRVIYTYDKQFMANGNHHEDKKYFLPGTRTTVAEIKIREQIIKVGTPICEDVWSQDHVRNIPAEMKSLGAELLVVCNHSYFTMGKQKTRDDMYSSHVKELKIPIIQVNAVGVGDIVKNIIIFDGGSSTYLPDEQCTSGIKTKSFSLERFKPDFKSFKLNEYNKHSNVLDKYKEIFTALVFTQREIFKNIGIKKAQVHLSGGLDSSIVACIVKEAMGSDNTIFITNPTTCNSTETKSFASHTADKLMVRLYWNQFESTYQAMLNSFEVGISETVEPIVKSTFHAVGRTAQGLAAANHFNSGIVCTGNHTEIVCGWANFHDIGSIGVMAIIGDLTKVECYKLAKWINNVYYTDIVIPEELYNDKFKPAAELPDSEGGDPFDYWVVSGICADLIRYRKNKYELIDDFKNKKLKAEHYPDDFSGKSIYDRISLDEFGKQVHRCYTLMRRSVFKAAQGAPIVLMNNRSRGFSNRETLINHYEY